MVAATSNSRTARRSHWRGTSNALSFSVRCTSKPFNLHNGRWIRARSKALSGCAIIFPLDCYPVSPLLLGILQVRFAPTFAQLSGLVPGLRASIIHLIAVLKMPRHQVYTHGTFSVSRFSTSATRRSVDRKVSGVTLMESMPSSTRNLAMSG